MARFPSVGLAGIGAANVGDDAVGLTGRDGVEGADESQVWVVRPEPGENTFVAVGVLAHSVENFENAFHAALEVWAARVSFEHAWIAADQCGISFLFRPKNLPNVWALTRPFSSRSSFLVCVNMMASLRVL